MKYVSKVKEEVMYFLEEVIQMGLENEYDENVYYDLLYTGRCKATDLGHVYQKMLVWEEVKF